MMSPLFLFTFTFMLLHAVYCYPSEQESSDSSEEQEEHPIYESSLEEEESGISTSIEEINKNIERGPDEPTVIGDIAIATDLKNADPCTSHKCKWRKSRKGIVYVPYVIDDEFSPEERSIIKGALQSFASSTCVYFKPRSREEDFLRIRSLKGCYSFIGRQEGEQVVSLRRPDCVTNRTIQHEMMHALGFVHEQSRSDRDKHVLIKFENIETDHIHNFRKVNTDNLGTPYDYNSILHYRRDAFSKNGRATIVPIPDRNVPIGMARKMSRWDFLKVNRLYKCKKSGRSGLFKPGF